MAVALKPTDMPVGVLSGIPDVITHAKFCVNQLRGFSAAAPPKSAISYTYSNDPYNSSVITVNNTTYSDMTDFSITITTSRYYSSVTKIVIRTSNTEAQQDGMSDESGKLLCSALSASNISSLNSNNSDSSARVTTACSYLYHFSI